MSATRTEYPAGVPCWVDTTQPDVDAAAEFYGGLFGWEFDERPPSGAAGRYLVGQMRGLAVAGIAAAPNGSDGPASWNMHVAVDDVDATGARVEAAGGSITAGPFDVEDAGRIAWVADAAGAGFAIWQAGAVAGAQLVNEPGSWSFNDLNVRDRDQAIAFYDAVFGWKTDAQGADGGDLTFWRRPGYGNFLDQLNPGTLARMEEMDAPEGFADAIGWLALMADDQIAAGTPAHWGTSFGIADADATAARAQELGGSVLLEPMDAPWVRMTIIRDPQGAIFTGSQFVPPD